MCSKYRIHTLTTAQTIIHKSFFLYLIPNLEEIVIPSMFWYIEGAGRHILVDSGGTGEELQRNSQFGSPWKDVRSFEDCLGTVGITPDEVDIVIQTHLHFDHALNTKKCHNAKVYVQKAEFEHARNPHPITGPMYKWFQKEGDNLDYVLLEGDSKLLSGIDILSVPGHSAGCQAVAVNTSRGRAIISGFCCLRENFDPPPPLRALGSVICPGIHLSAVQAYESLWRVKRLADIVIPMHEPSFMSLGCI
jgi:glyoxylase-like metal-dependent hydrolase (beta-lactamase superfamily II)